MDVAFKYWIWGAIAFWIVIWLTTTGSAEKVRVPLRSLAISMAFAPTVVVAGWIGFPAPATLVLLGHFFAHKPKPYQRGYVENLLIAGFCFVVFFGLTFMIYMHQARKKREKEEVRPTA